MDYFEIESGSRLSGEISVYSAKNAVLPMMASTILTKNGTNVFRNIPNIADVRMMANVLRKLGADVDFDKDKHILSIDTENVNNFEAPYELVRKMRASFLVMGPLLARFGIARVSQPGGCAIGSRPIDQHIKGFSQLGAEICEEHGYTVARAKQLHGNVVYFDRPTHTGTENIMMSAVLADGTTKIINAAQDPEIADLAEMLNQMGAKITGAGTSIITIDGVNSLEAVDYTPIGDRLEASTYLFATICTGGEITVNNISPEHLNTVLFKIIEMNAKLELGENWIKLTASGCPRAVDIITDPYPGFATDVQPIIMAALCRADGTSVVWERIFENRFIHIMELQRLGANITISGDRATIVGVKQLEGAEIMASDIRAGAGLTIAALGANSKSVVRRVYHIDRGYQRLEERLSSLGAKIVRKTD
ncbi:UDP-N-acetylglucosamine 1-carboxyvinyltransferase [bacterium]|nr:UDP-N-acetylglucosamine 1-carboxyvinyltransferase [bacterium]